ncbi:MAG: EAL domain-containing protein [Vicinamibacterales bacterium]
MQTHAYAYAVPVLLLIERETDDRPSVERLVADARDVLRVERVTSLDAGVKRLREPGIKGVLLDLLLPESRDLSSVDELRRVAPDKAIVVLARASDQLLARRAVDRGAADYVVTDHLDARTLCQLIAMMFQRRSLEEQRFVERERAEVTLNSICDAVVTTDITGNVTYLNREAEARTGWSRFDAFARPVMEIFDVMDGLTGEIAQNPARLAIEKRAGVGFEGGFILVSRDGKETAIEHSASPMHDHRGKIVGAVIVFRDVVVSRDRSRQMLHLAEHDALTDLPNRLLFNDRLTRAIALARRHQRRLAVLFLDCDRFKHVNDTLGHEAGDQLLQSIARRLTASVRESDTVSRHGGDEFLILLSEVDQPGGAAQIANKIIAAVAAPHDVAQHEICLTASVGISLYPEDGQDAQTLIMHADAAMYDAKAAGRNQVGFFRPAADGWVSKRSSIESELRKGLERSEFRLHYQPTIDLLTGAIAGAEALMRWEHPARGLVPPDQFIPAAEACGLIVPMGRWALGEACRQAKAWQDAGLPPIPIAVNVSALQFRNAGFLEDIRDILQDTGLDPRYLELELTESALMVDVATTSALLSELKRSGVGLKVDDFGTGPSSLSYLQRFPVDVLKIDQAFVREIQPAPEGAPIVRAVIAMGKSLGCRVIAEGVETRQQLAYLKEEQCDEVQGYHFSPAVEPSAFEGLLTRAPWAFSSLGG